MKQSIIIYLFLVLGIGANAQINKVNLQASGLTCSMCNLSIKKSLDKLSFIGNINSDVETATYELEIRENMEISFDEIRGAVINSGFSVAKLSFFLNIKDIDFKNEFSYHNKLYNIIDGNISQDKLDIEFQIMNRGFISEKFFKQYKNKLKEGTYNLLEKDYKIK